MVMEQRQRRGFAFELGRWQSSEEDKTGQDR